MVSGVGVGEEGGEGESSVMMLGLMYPGTTDDTALLQVSATELSTFKETLL